MIDEDYSNYFPQNNKWLSLNAHLKVSKARKLNKNWGLGISGTYYKTFLNKYVSENKLKSNIVLDLSLSRKIYSNFIVSIGGFLASNIYSGVSNHEFRKGNEGLFGNRYAELKMSLRYLNNDKTNKYSFYSKNDSIETLFKNNINNFVKKNI